MPRFTAPSHTSNFARLEANTCARSESDNNSEHIGPRKNTTSKPNKHVHHEADDLRSQCEGAGQYGPGDQLLLCRLPPALLSFLVQRCFTGWLDTVPCIVFSIAGCLLIEGGQGPSSSRQATTPARYDEAAIPTNDTPQRESRDTTKDSKTITPRSYEEVMLMLLLLFGYYTYTIDVSCSSEDSKTRRGAIHPTVRCLTYNTTCVAQSVPHANRYHCFFCCYCTQPKVLSLAGVV